jgi:putative transposase
VTQRGTNRQRVFFSAGDHRRYLSLAREQVEESGVRVLAYCLMSNHVHLVVVPERADSLAVLFRRVHGRYAQYLNIRRQRSGHLWQQRFFSCPLSERHLWVALKYVEQNPCRAGLVRRAEEYRWSSAAAHLGCKDASGMLDLGFWERSGRVETWRQMHEAADDTRRIELLRRCTYSGRPFGEEEFVQRLEQQFHRAWRRWGFEKMAAGAPN